MVGLRDDRTLLAAWEAGQAWPSVAAGAVMVAWHRSEDTQAVLAQPLSATAAQAITAFVTTFGEQASCSYNCPGCAEPIDVPLDLRQFQTLEPAAEPIGVDTAAGRVVVHALTTRDLLEAATTADPGGALRACCLRDPVGRKPSAETLAGLSDLDLEAIDEAADRLAGAAAIVLRMTCPSCGDDVRAPLDPTDLLWDKVCLAGPRLLADVATLARAFSWTEDVVLSLSPARRRAYLALASASPHDAQTEWRRL